MTLRRFSRTNQEKTAGLQSEPALLFIMPTKIVVPELGESILEATVGRWLKKEGDHIVVGEPIVALETEKVDLEVGAERSGVLTRIEHQQGDDVKIGDTLGLIEESASAAPAAQTTTTPPPSASLITAPGDGDTGGTELQSSESRSAASAAGPAPSPAESGLAATPSARRLAREHDLDLAKIPTGEAGRITRESVESYLAQGIMPAKERDDNQASSEEVTPRAGATTLKPVPPPVRLMPALTAEVSAERREERQRMSRRRQTIARRLVEAQHTAAMLTTFNEIDMSAVMDLRKRHKESFKQKYGVGLGISSFFVKATVGALRAFPHLNAEIQGDEIVLYHYYDIGIAVGAAGGLVVPVLRDADRLSFASIEQNIKGFAKKAAEGTLALEDLRGGTFTVTNGGVFGSLMSTPILNPPQAGILGLHKIQERPVGVNGQIVLRPMMYVALSYDHRLVDGLEAVQFLVRIKELVEDPASLLLES